MTSTEYAAVKAVFDGYGVPEAIWRAIMMAESGGDPNAHNTVGRDDSVGLFQLNRRGGQGAGYSVQQLRDPVFNARIAAPAIASAYRRYGANIVNVAQASGHPGWVKDGANDRRIQNIVDFYQSFGGAGSGVAMWSLAGAPTRSDSANAIVIVMAAMVLWWLVIG